MRSVNQRKTVNPREEPQTKKSLIEMKLVAIRSLEGQSHTIASNEPSSCKVISLVFQGSSLLASEQTHRMSEIVKTPFQDLTLMDQTPKHKRSCTKEVTWDSLTDPSSPSNTATIPRGRG